MPETSFYLSSVQVTKQKGFGRFDLPGYWQRQYRGKNTDEPWYLLTNLGGSKAAIWAYIAVATTVMTLVSRHGPSHHANNQTHSEALLKE